MKEAFTRREFVVAAAAVAATALHGEAQEGGQEVRTTMSGPMDENRYRPVILAPKANAVASMNDEQRDALEHQIHCVCGCPLDVYTCRTTDFICPVSPQMHGDVVRLIAGGYTAPEILAAFVAVYGERVLMAPLRSGFNWAGYLAPFVAIGTAGIVVAGLITRWRAASTRAIATDHTPIARANATPDELARLDAAIRDDHP